MKKQVYKANIFFEEVAEKFGVDPEDVKRLYALHVENIYDAFKTHVKISVPNIGKFEFDPAKGLSYLYKLCDKIELARENPKSTPEKMEFYFKNRKRDINLIYKKLLKLKNHYEFIEKSIEKWKRNYEWVEELIDKD